ncbi:MAG: hypothetical protein H0W07_00470 [Chloroflexi bacterium]|nr:hypothetical protein [Chloroflexota bacterium]
MPAGDGSEQGLVQRARDGDHDAFSALVVPELRRLHGLAGLILRDPSRAEDALQEALFRAWRDPACRPGRSSTSTSFPWRAEPYCASPRTRSRAITRRSGGCST